MNQTIAVQNEYRRIANIGPSTRDATKPRHTRQRAVDGSTRHSASTGATYAPPTLTATVSHADRPIPARPTPIGVKEGSRGSCAATTPGPRPQPRLHPEGGARKRGSTQPTLAINHSASPLRTPPPTGRPKGPAIPPARPSGPGKVPTPTSFVGPTGQQFLFVSPRFSSNGCHVALKEDQKRPPGRTNPTGPKRPPGRNAEWKEPVTHVGRPRGCRGAGNTSRKAGQKPKAPSPTPSCGAIVRPPRTKSRGGRSGSNSRPLGWLSREPSVTAIRGWPRSSEPASPDHATLPHPRPAAGAPYAPPLDIPAWRHRREAHPPKEPSGNTVSPPRIRGDKPTPVSTPRR
jgi:hypothetical protein